jgi:hypothetical protein
MWRSCSILGGVIDELSGISGCFTDFSDGMLSLHADQFVLYCHYP